MAAVGSTFPVKTFLVKTFFVKRFRGIFPAVILGKWLFSGWLPTWGSRKRVSGVRSLLPLNLRSFFIEIQKSISEMFIKIYRKEGCIIPYFCFCILLGNIYNNVWISGKNCRGCQSRTRLRYRWCFCPVPEAAGRRFGSLCIWADIELAIPVSSGWNNAGILFRRYRRLLQFGAASAARCNGNE